MSGGHAATQLYADALARDGALRLLSRNGAVPLQLERWRRPADVVDVAVAARCTGPVLDIGCGPGRMVAALAALGVPALGVDLVGEAVEMTRRSGGLALCRDVFAPLPGEGRWRDVLLLDGNVGIGGDVAALLARVARLLRPGGQVIAEVDEDPADEVVVAVVEDDRGRRSAPFRWARIGTPALVRRGAACGLRVEDTWAAQGRRFAALRLERCGLVTATASVPAATTARAASVPRP